MCIFVVKSSHVPKKMNCFGWSMIWPFVVARPMVRDFPDCPVTHFASCILVLDTCLSDRDREQTEFINNQDVSSKCRFTPCVCMLLSPSLPKFCRYRLMRCESVPRKGICRSFFFESIAMRCDFLRILP